MARVSAARKGVAALLSIRVWVSEDQSAPASRRQPVGRDVHLAVRSHHDVAAYDWDNPGLAMASMGTRGRPSGVSSSGRKITQGPRESPEGLSRGALYEPIIEAGGTCEVGRKEKSRGRHSSEWVSARAAKPSSRMMSPTTGSECPLDAGS